MKKNGFKLGKRLMAAMLSATLVLGSGVVSYAAEVDEIAIEAVVSEEAVAEEVAEVSEEVVETPEEDSDVVVETVETEVADEAEVEVTEEASEVETKKTYCVKLASAFYGIWNYKDVYYNAGEAIEKPADPKAFGYELVGWYKGISRAEGDEYDFSKTVAENFGEDGNYTLYAKFNIHRVYTITYHCGEGTNSDLNAPVYYEGMDKYLEDAVAPEGYEFDGWYTSPDFDEEGYVLNVSELSGNVDLYAKYSEVRHYVALYTMTSVWIPSYRYVYYKQGETIGRPADPVRKGFTFTGWYTGLMGGDEYDFTKTVVENFGEYGDFVIYAHWVKNAEITYPNGKEITVAAGKKINFTVAVTSGEKVSYCWYYKAAKGDGKFHKAGCYSDTYTRTASKKIDGMQAYCVVTDSKGKKLTSDVLTFKLK